MSIIRIWANRLIAGTKVWSEVPEKRKKDIKAELALRVKNGVITQDEMDAIIK